LVISGSRPGLRLRDRGRVRAGARPWAAAVCVVPLLVQPPGLVASPGGPAPTLAPAPVPTPRSGQGSADASPTVPPRNETLYTSGSASTPPTNFDPLSDQSYTGSQGLLYEPLFLYDPLHGTFIPWLASSGAWVTPTSYRIVVRNDVSWVSSATGDVVGTLSGTDVAYSIKLAMADGTNAFHPDVAGATGVKVTGDSVTVDFAKPVGYAQWQEFLWHAPVLPSLSWPKFSHAGATFAGPSLVSTGPMLLYSVNKDEACYKDNPHWWASAQLKLSFKFTYLCDVVSGSSGRALSDLLADHIDWSNQLLRGIATLSGGGYDIKTYYPSQPYMIPASTAWLQMDLAKAPMDSLDFRLAVAHAVNSSAIVSDVYTGTVLRANPTGLLPELSSYIDASVVKKHGFTYSPAEAKEYLKKSGYSGQQLRLLIPVGRVDLFNAATLIGQQLGKVGVHIDVMAVPVAERDHDVADGNYDMAIVDSAGLGATPWSYFDSIYQLPLPAAIAGGDNTERYSSTADWGLVQEAAGTPLTDTTALQGIYANLELDFLEQLPEIPLWYSGAWFQANTKTWQNYPLSTSKDDRYTPVMWRGWLGATTTVLALADLKPTR